MCKVFTSLIASLPYLRPFQITSLSHLNTLLDNNKFSMFFKLLYLHFYVIDGVVLIDPDFVKDGKKGL